jgi:CHASE2 domain-containing sensor protein
MFSSLNTIILCIGLASFVIGFLEPLIHEKLMLFFLKINKKEKTTVFLAVVTLIVSLGLCSLALLYLSTFEEGVAPVIVLSFMIGIGCMKWLRGEL